VRTGDLELSKKKKNLKAEERKKEVSGVSALV